MQVQLPAAIKAKLVTQVLVQKERDALIWGNDGVPVKVLLKPGVLIGIGWGGLLSYPIILLTVSALRPCLFSLALGCWGRIHSVFGALSPLPSWLMGRLPSAS